METDSQIINRVIENIRKKFKEEKEGQAVSKEKSCPFCGGKGLQEVGPNTWRKCKCRELEEVEELWNKSDMGFDSMTKTWQNFEPVTQAQKDMKNISTNYFLRFKDIRNTEQNSIMFLGQSGCGKTHLLSATAYKLIKDEKVGVVYMSFVDSMTKLKQDKVVDPQNYQRLINKYKNCEVLFIDDLFKGKITESDILIAFEIINFRINRRLPFMISSELFIDELKRYDNAIAGRMFNAARGCIKQVEGKENDYRLRTYYAKGGK